MFDSLPLHPLLVHFGVVLTLLAGLAQLLALVLPRFRAWFGWGLPLLAVVAAVVTRIAQSFGEALVESGTIDETAAVKAHVQWGEKAGWAAIALGVLSLLDWWLRRRGVSGSVRTAVSVLAALAAVAAIVLVTLAGHSGAVSVWTA